ncbi:uncharacterized protein I303_108639 [Kwoniella dejecticola CBS 10117]|uniref:NADPH:adrenodoxin oxidoreductase, mitochondrial n=1 Tax=Kwoniella dejecticola CBS 10117 TaxID=1296121 RepID=A0A1A5ZWU4_9TREE|nr:ferredoxin-NADP+ reductase [Kwoniella dejecticola CBS 10117]OBR82277.1 ferredoxin-NADP+ reductase [Kwoniella dejecticola CBS 10117]
MLPRPARFRQVPPLIRLVSRASTPGRTLIPQCQTYSTETSAERPLKIAIIGSGPSGFYTASRILNSIPADSPNGQNVQVHMYERLPTPYGLVRYGVAPDHPEVKNCQHKFDELSSDARFKFFGNVLISSQPSSSQTISTPSSALSPYTYPHSVRISFDEVLPYYSTLILTYGASLSNPLSSVPGSSSSSKPLGNVIPALGLVSWYNSHPAFCGLPVNLRGVEEVSVVGQGNVALDVARILLKPIDQLSKTDLSEEVLQTLSESSVRKVRVVGRRGPGQVAFTTKEFREMLSIPDLEYRGVSGELMQQAKDLVGNERMKKRLLGLMEKSVKNDSGRKSFALEFLRSPKAFLPSTGGGIDTGAVGEVEWNVNQLLSSSPTTTPSPTPPDSQVQAVPTGNTVMARPTGETVTRRADMVIESVGYRSEPLTGEEGGWNLPFDEKRGRVKNVDGRVVDEEGVVVPGIYAAGWAARGPVGVIASTMHDAYALSDLLMDDHYATKASQSQSQTTAGPLNPTPENGVPEALVKAQKNGGIVVDLEGWAKIDQAERDRARIMGKGKEREKFRKVEDMLAVLG